MFAAHGRIKERFKGKLYSGVKVETGGKEFCVVKCGIGSGPAGDAIMLIAESCAEEVVFLGSCGGLGELSLGDIVVGNSAFNGEGFSCYHDGSLLGKIFGDNGKLKGRSTGYTEKLKIFMKENNETVKYADVYTIGSLTAESKDFLSRIEKKGFSAVEMELSAVYTAAERTGMNAVGILFVSDLPLSAPLWSVMDAPAKEKCAHAKKKSIEIAVDFVTR